MIQLIYIIIFSYFIAGGIGFYFINRHKAPEVARKSYTKFGIYFIIINILFFSIVINPIAFRYLTVIIIVVGLIELIKLFRQSGFKKKSFFVLSVVDYAVLSTGLFIFSGFNKDLILFSFLILSIFDSFSQITGQLWGKTKILPGISPNKTLGGVVGGTIIALISAFLLNSLFSGTTAQLVLLTSGIILFAFTGDLAASLFKRKYHQKDFSNIIPGHGGFLDRFDSLIAGGAWVAFCIYVII
jgi:phosphatidate cytidylyltransferase